MMKLSEAIRVGSKMHPASECGWNDVGPNGEIRTCALLAAAEGAGIFTFIGNVSMPGPNYRPPQGPDQFIRDETVGMGTKAAVPEEWNALLNTHEIPPCECKTLRMASPVLLLVWHLHDVHRWSREAVAEWIEMLENAMEAKAIAREAQRREIAQDLDIEP